MNTTQLYNYFDYLNQSGTRMFSIAPVGQMPARYGSIIFTGTFEECNSRLNPKGLEGSVEDLF